MNNTTATTPVQSLVVALNDAALEAHSANWTALRAQLVGLFADTLGGDDTRIVPVMCARNLDEFRGACANTTHDLLVYPPK